MLPYESRRGRLSASCLTCTNVHGCKEARVAHICTSFEYTPLVASREALVKIVGESAAIKALKKTKEGHMAPEHPDTKHIKDLVSAGNVAGLEELRHDTETIKLPYLVMSASHITGDSTKIGSMLRGQADKRSALIDLLVELASEARPVQADAEVDAASPESEPEPAPKKRRKRRTKAQIEADRAAAEAAEAAETAASAPTPALSVDFDRAFNDILTSIDDAQRRNAEINREIRAAAKHEHEVLLNHVVRLSNAVIALEEQLLLTGIVLEPVVAAYLDPAED